MSNAAPTLPTPDSASAPAAPASPTPEPKVNFLKAAKVAGAAVVAFAGGWQLTEWAVAAYTPVVSFLKTVATDIANVVTSAAELVGRVAVDMWNAGMAAASAVDAAAHAHPWLAMAVVGAAAAGAAWHVRGEADEAACDSCDVEGMPPAVAEGAEAEDREEAGIGV